MPSARSRRRDAASPPASDQAGNAAPQRPDGRRQSVHMPGSRCACATGPTPPRRRSSCPMSSRYSESRGGDARDLPDRRPRPPIAVQVAGGRTRPRYPPDPVRPRSHMLAPRRAHRDRVASRSGRCFRTLRAVRALTRFWSRCRRVRFRSLTLAAEPRHEGELRVHRGLPKHRETPAIPAPLRESGPRPATCSEHSDLRGAPEL